MAAVHHLVAGFWQPHTMKVRDSEVGCFCAFLLYPERRPDMSRHLGSHPLWSNSMLRRHGTVTRVGAATVRHAGVVTALVG